jgi:threonyl-tRNA synthetase
MTLDEAIENLTLEATPPDVRRKMDAKKAKAA